MRLKNQTNDFSKEEIDIEETYIESDCDLFIRSLNTNSKESFYPEYMRTENDINWEYIENRKEHIDWVKKHFLEIINHILRVSEKGTKYNDNGLHGQYT